jgi:hypothetical protein
MNYDFFAFYLFNKVQISVKSSVFLDITPCSPLRINQRFGGICRLHLQGRSISQAIKQGVCYLLHTGFLLGLFFDPEDGGDVFFPNVS